MTGGRVPWLRCLQPRDSTNVVANTATTAPGFTMQGGFNSQVRYVSLVRIGLKGQDNLALGG